jgi:post-segregation antitoxin (ccd killing protein)
MKRLVQVTIYLDAQLLQAARERSANMQVSLSAAIVEALKESLLSTYRSEREQEILKAVERNFHALRRLDQRLAVELAVLKEMAGLGMRSFFNHTTPIPEATKAAAILSGKQRFHGYLDTLAKNLRKGESILSDVPLPEFDAPSESKTPQGEVSVKETADPFKTERSTPVEKPASRRGVERPPDLSATQPAAANGQKVQRNWGLFEPQGET